jgi:hypothetical protein
MTLRVGESDCNWQQLQSHERPGVVFPIILYFIGHFVDFSSFFFLPYILGLMGTVSNIGGRDHVKL